MIEQRLIDQKIRKVLKNRSKKPTIINKIGFYIYIENHLSHLLPIIKHLPQGSVEFITPETNGIPKYFDRTDIPVHSSLDLLADSKKFKCVVSLFMVAPSWFQSLENHFIDGNKNLGSHYFKRLAEKNVRMVYSLGALPWNTSNVMKSFDCLLVYGPHEEKLYENQFDNKMEVHQVGYPKFDDFFSNELPKLDCEEKLNNNFKTILWLPTKNLLSSIPKYSNTMIELSKNYNVILKPHPQENLEFLKEIKNSNIILCNYHDSAPFYKLADFVFCDYGGSSFGALYCNKPIVFLSPDNPEKDLTNYSHCSPEIELRKYFLTLTDEAPKKILLLLQDSKFWLNDCKNRAALREKFFLNNYGESGRTAASFLVSLIQH